MTMPAPDRSWEQMANDVLVHGAPYYVISAAEGWEVLLHKLRTVQYDLQRNVQDLKNNNLWKGPAYEEFARYVNRVAADIEELIILAQGGSRWSDVSYELRSCANLLIKHGADMPRPAELENEFLVAAKARRSLPDGTFTQYKKKLEEAKSDNKNISDWWFNSQTNAATTTYEEIDRAYQAHIYRIPDAPKDIARTRSMDDSSPGAGGGGGGAPSSGAGGLGGGLPKNPGAISSSGVGSGAPGRIPDLSSDSGGKLSQDESGEPLRDSSRDGSRSNPVWNGGGLAGANSGLGSGGVSSGSGLGPGSGGSADATSTGRPGGIVSSGGLPGGNAPGKPVAPPMGGLPLGAAGNGSSAGGRRRSGAAGQGGLLTNPPQRGSRREDGHKGPSDWLYEDEDVWGSNSHEPPPVLNGDWDPT